MKIGFKQPAEAIERANMVEAQRQQDYAGLARFFAEAAQTNKQFEYEAQFYTKLADQARVGALLAVVGKARETVSPEFLAGYDIKRAAMAAKREQQAAEMAEYNRLADAGMTDAEIQKAMGK